MTSSTLFEEINRKLFFSDVPDGTLTHKPKEQKSARGFGETINNLGSDLHNTLFFDDLKTVVPEKKEQKPKYGLPPPDPKKAFMSLDAVHEEKGKPMELLADETSLQRRSRGLTIPPPSLARVQAENKYMQEEKEFEQVVKQYAEKMVGPRPTVDVKV